MKLFIIDNETTRLRNLRSILASLGYKSADVESCDDPTQAVGLLKKKHYDCMFVYMTMPKLSGLDLVKEVRGNSRLRSLPVVIYSAEVSKETVVTAVQAGASGFLGYPFSVSDVESSLKQAMARKK